MYIFYLFVTTGNVRREPCVRSKRFRAVFASPALEMALPNVLEDPLVRGHYKADAAGEDEADAARLVLGMRRNEVAVQVAAGRNTG
jgi:hypothetical protein